MMNLAIRDAENEMLPRVKKVVATSSGFVLQIEWQDGSKAKADLTGLIYSSRHFGVFAENPDAFRKVKPVAWGDGIEWDNGLDYSANTLKELAEEQRPMTGAELRQFANRKNLNNEEFAELLGCTVKTLRVYNKARRVPQWVATTVRCFARDDIIFAAHFRPVTVRPRGRPKILARK